jgi:L-ascorbate metabolism protein UlaG (beta-lactamase superfamily)
VTAGLITHCRFGHFDHLDKSGSRHLAKLGIPVYCNQLDENYLQKRGVQTMPLKPNQKYPFCDGFIITIETTHGYGVSGNLMVPGLGYLLEFPGEPSIYISGDTVLTPIVKKVLTDQKPDIATLASGAASLDIGKPILMPLSEQVEFIRHAPGIVIATHMEALNHCPVTRDQFRDAVTQEDLIHKVRVPMDGEVLLF